MGQAGAPVAITSCYRAPRRDTIAGKTTRDTIVGNVGGDNQRHLQLHMYISFKPFDTHTLVTETVCDTLVAKTQLASDNLKWSVSTQWQNVTTSSCRGRKNGKMHRSETGSCRKSAALPPHSDKKTFRQALIILFPNNSWIFKKEKRVTVYQICWFCISCCADGNHLYWCHHLDFMPG